MLLSYLSSAAIGDTLVSTNMFFLPLLTVIVGGDVFEVGLVGGLSYAVYTFMPFVFGKYSDKFRSKHRLLVLSFLIITAVSVVYALATNATELIFARLVEGIGWSIIWPVIQSSLVHLSADSKRILTIYNSVWSAAYATGPLIAGILTTLESIHYVFYFTSAVAASGIVVNAIFYNFEPGRRQEPLENEIKETTTSKEKSNASSGRQSRLVFYVFAIIVSAVTIGTTLTFFGPFARSLGISAFVIGVVSAAYGFARFVFFTLAVRDRFRSLILHPKHKDRIIVVLLALISALGTSLLVKDNVGGFYFVIFLAIGSCYAVLITIIQVSIVADAPRSGTGAAAGVFESSLGLGVFMGPIVAGAVAEYLSISPFLVPVFPSAVFVVASFLLRGRLMLR
jgi:MFS family permease